MPAAAARLRSCAHSSIVEGAVAGAEVVHKEGDAEGAESVEDVDGGVEVGNDAGLSHFEAELMAGDAGLQEERLHVVGEAGAGELPGREIDANAQGAIVGVFAVPGLDLAAGFGEAPVADREDEAALFGSRDEVLRREDAAFGMDPSDQGLDGDPCGGRRGQARAGSGGRTRGD
jgi:hypothetical protein